METKIYPMKTKLQLFIAFILLCTVFNGYSQIDSTLAPFLHGVASGDPTDNGVILWTRVTPSSSSTSPIQVSWRISTDTTFLNVVQSGTATAQSTNDYSVNVIATGLTANKWYYYQFFALNKYSLTGRTRTLPTGNIDSIRFAIVSCSNYQAGFYNVYKSIADRNDVDAVLHLGDYQYEYAVGGFGYDASLNRAHDPSTEAITLTDYRKRHAQSKSDADSRRMLQQYPLIAIWDDHEVANDAYKDGAENHNPLTEGSWAVRLAAAKQAYFEWMPVRKPDPINDPGRLYRNFNFGNLIELNMIDTRLQGRTQQIATSSPQFNDTSRTIMGIPQRNWLFNEIATSTAKWNILGQQVMLTPLLAFGAVVNIDQWDGYPAERTRLYNTIKQYSNKNLIVLTGDIHSAWGNDLPQSGYSFFNRSASAGVEFVCPSVTSPNPLSGLSSALIKLFNSNVRYADLSYYGYTILDVNKLRAQGDWYSVNTVKSKTFTTSYKQSWFVRSGEKFLRQASSAASRPVAKQPIPAPRNPMIFTPRIGSEFESNLFTIYPNPTNDILIINIETSEESNTQIAVYDITGKVIQIENINLINNGFTNYPLNVSEYNAGTYFINVSSKFGNQSKVFIKL
jgi:alkaline phosphatase D